MKNGFLFALSCLLALPLAAQSQITGGTCSAASLSGTYELTMTGRTVSAGRLSGGFQGVGTATFDGQSKFTFSVVANTNQALAKPLSYAGTYTIGTNCSGTLTVSTGTTAAFALVVWNAGKDFNLAGEDATYAYTASGAVQPAACATSTLSGEFTYTTSGFLDSSGSINGTADEDGLLQFDGQGNVTATSTTSGGTSAQSTSTGTYTVSAGCTGSATLATSAGKATALNFSIMNVNATAFSLIEGDSQFVRSGTAHAAFLNPSQSIGNVASYAVGYTPPGSVFVIFGTSLATKAAGAVTTNLPTTLLNTTVTVNGELAPLFYVDPGQIDAQMPWDIPAGTVATVIVKNGTSASNAAAVAVPATGTPGISVYSNNRAVVVNQNGTVNSGSAPASVGDEVVAYFTGGGPVQSAGKLVSGSPAPGSLSPLTETSTVTVGGTAATVEYIGLTPLSIGLYQANFLVPSVTKGSYAVVITIGGQASNNPVMTVSN